MSLHYPLRAVDRTRAGRALVASLANDQAGLTVVLAETQADPQGASGLVLALLEYADWLSVNTGPLTGEADQL